MSNPLCEDEKTGHKGEMIITSKRLDSFKDIIGNDEWTLKKIT